MKVSTLENEIRHSRNQRHFSLVVLLGILLFTGLNFSLIHNALPALNSIGPQGTLGTEGKQGLQGPQGMQGLQGVSGASGANGQPGIMGIVGAPGATGPVGQQGEPGPQGEQGAAGDPGQDGRELEQRCRTVDGRSRIEQRHTGEFNWTVAYYLPEGSSCP